MKTKRLQEVVDMVSSILAEHPVNTETIFSHNSLTISTEIWDFNYIKLNDAYVYDCTTINNNRLAEEMYDIEPKLMREVIMKYTITNDL
tara:strand:- start:149 stop:415 length:267 start_codon:yes stop_codon:yes gene_type:complete